MLGAALWGTREHVWLWYPPRLMQERVIPDMVMLKAIAYLLKKQSGNIRCHCK